VEIEGDYVTEKLIKLIGHSTQIQATNTTFGDPCPDREKVLLVRFGKKRLDFALQELRLEDVTINASISSLPQFSVSITDCRKALDSESADDDDDLLKIVIKSVSKTVIAAVAGQRQANKLL